MADTRRPSGRQGAAPSAATSGRAAATSASGRGAPPASNPQMTPARPSGRAPAAPPVAPNAAGSGRMPATPTASTSGRMQATASPSASGRMPAPKPAAVPVPMGKPSGRMGAAKSNKAMPPGRSGRAAGNERGGGRGAKKKGGVGGPELMIAGGVLLVLLVAVIAFYFMKTGEQASANKMKEDMVATEQENFKLAKEKADAADMVGRLWCQGDESITEDKLKSAFAGDAKVYNVIFTRKKKDKRGKEDEKSVYVNDGHMGPIGSINRTSDEKDIHMEYAFAEGRAVELVKAVRSVLPKDGDPLNMGGSITVLVNAKHDAHFEKAKNPPKKEEKPADKAPEGK